MSRGKRMSPPPLPTDLNRQEFGAQCSSSESTSESYSRGPFKSPSRSGDFDEKSTSDASSSDLGADHNNHDDTERKETSTNATTKSSHYTLYLFIEINDETIPIRTSSRNTVKQIFEQLLIHRRIVSPSGNARVVFIHKASNKLLHPHTSLAEQAVSDQSTLRILQKQPNTKLKLAASGSGSVRTASSGHSLSCSPQKPHKLTFICSFGVPYHEEKITLSYHRNVSLDDYAVKIKQYLTVAADIQITFNFRGTPCLGDTRQRGIAQLGISPGDEVHAYSIGITVTLRPYQCPKNGKLIELYRDFSYAMLIEQVKLELGISREDITALIGKNFNVIDSDSKCRQIREYQTITVLTRCDCLHCAHEPIIQETATDALPALPFYDAAPMDFPYDYQAMQPMDTQPPMQPLEMRPNEEFLSQRYQLRRVQECAPPALPPGYENPNAFFFYDPYPNYHDYSYEYHYQTAQTSATQQTAVSDYYHHHTVGTNDVKEIYPPLSKRKGRRHRNGHNVINGKVITKKFLKPIPKLCRYGADCRYFKNPHISGPCRYYHPPSGPPPWKTHYSLHHGILKKNKYKNNYIVSEVNRSSH